MNPLWVSLQFFGIILGELIALFLGISTLVGLVLQYVSDETLRRWLSRRGLLGNFLGAALGAITPFCSCSTIPMTVGLLRAGVGQDSADAFAVTLPAGPVADAIGGDAKQPGLKAARLLVPVQIVNHPQEDVLQQVFGQVPVAGGPRQVGVERAAKEAEDLLERLGLAPAAALHQSGQKLPVHSGRHSCPPLETGLGSRYFRKSGDPGAAP